MAKYTRGLQAADLYSLQTLQESLDTVIADDFMEVTSSDDFLESATKDDLIRLLQIENIAATSEQQVYEAVMRWLTHDPSRKEHAAAVLGHVRLAQVDVDVLYAQLETDFGATQDGKILILEAMAYHGLSTRRKLNWPRSKLRTPVKTLLALSSEARIFTTKGWRSKYDIAAVSYSWSSTIGEAQMVAVDARLFLVCGSQKKAWSFDTTVGLWTEIPPVAENGATALVRGDTVYVAGGETVVDGNTVDNTTVEMCRVSVRDGVAVSAWSVVPQPLCVHRFASQVAVIDRKAYFILGGQMHFEFTGKFVDHDRTSEEYVEGICSAFRKDVKPDNVVCATLLLNEKK
ncbi:KLHL3 [Branchiostoma lanceolatum]|nr:KLHL3 [Branchiostoma lanceolatum]